MKKSEKQKVFIIGSTVNQEREVINDEFEKVGNIIKEKNYDIINPLEQITDDVLFSDKYIEEYIQMNISLLFKCTHFTLIPGWGDDKKAKILHYIAANRDLKFVQSYTN